MGGRAAHIDVPMIQSKTSSPIFPSPSPPHRPPSSLNFPDSVHNFSALRQHSTSDRLSEKQNKSHNSIFGTVPSRFEVETAFSALQKFLQGICSSGPEFKRVLQTFGVYGRLDMPFLLLLRKPTIKRLVISLASDKAVWDALMNNQMVRQLLDSYAHPAHNYLIESCKEDPDVIASIISWLVDVTKAKVTELMRKFELLMNQIFQQPEGIKDAEENREEADEIVRSSFILSLVILLIVVVTRFHNP